MLTLAQPRRVSAQDYRQLSHLLLREANVHRHLDWRSPLEWIGAEQYWALEEDGRLVAALACPEDPPRVAWIRVFAYQPHLSAAEAWNAVWQKARGEIPPRAFVASIVAKFWFERLLLSSGFERAQNIVLMEALPAFPPPYRPPRDFVIRPMRLEDAPAVAALDYEAFGWFWHNTADSLRRALSFAVHATVAENQEGLLGYQISTGASSSVHVARIAVKPQAQGRGIGFTLLNEMMRSAAARRYTLNTQENNAASLALYRRAGFSPTGEKLPVLAYSTESRTI